MNGEAVRTIAPEVRLLLAITGLLLPRSLRRDWRREWVAEFLHGFGEVPPLASIVERSRALVRAAGAISDSWTLVQIHGWRRRLAELTRARATPAVLSAVALATVAWSTHGFADARHFLNRPRSDRLVLLVQPIPFMGKSARVPTAQIAEWRRGSSAVEALGVWNVENGSSRGKPSRVLKASSTASLLLAESPIRPLYNVVEREEDYSPQFAGVIVKLRPGATASQIEAELSATAKLQKSWRVPGVIPLAALSEAPILPVGIVLAVLVLATLVSMRTDSVPALLYAMAGPCLCLATIAGVWLEAVARTPVTETGQIPLFWCALLYFFPIAAAALAMWLFRRSAAHRCRTCFQPLLSAVCVGMEGRCLFEPGGSEHLCAEGHGALVVGHAAQSKSDKEWISWSRTWA